MKDRLHLKVGVLWAGLVLLGACAATGSSKREETSVTVGAAHPFVHYSGRSEGIGTDAVSFGYSGARVRLRFEGTSVGMWMDDDSGENYVMAWIDGEPLKTFRLDAEDGYYPLADRLVAGPHTVEVARVTECHFGLNRFRGFAIGGEIAKALAWRGREDRKIEFIGDSITCGYGVEANDPNEHFKAETENFCLGYSGLAARKLGADYLVVSRSGIGMVRNYDGPYEGSETAMPDVYPHTFYMRPETNWDYRRFTPDVVCVNLGTNDFSTSGVNVETFVSEYIAFGTMLLERYPEAKLVAIQGPMNNSEELEAALYRVVGQLEKVAPGRAHFLELSPQGSVGFGADYHPNEAQSRINAEELVAYLSELMGGRW